ncbi:response regulator transcription factor [Aquifex pyrophilus]
MKILIVSFDKNLVDSLKAQLEGYEVYTAKNAEEAIALSPPDIDVIVFDAISGAISEEEINHLYEKKFQNQKYVILYDELFPVDVNNIKPPKKILISREAPPEEIINKMFEETSEKIETAEKEQKEEAVPVEEKTESVQKIEEGEKPLVLIVSFDKRLTDNLEKVLKDNYRTEVVKNMKAVKEKGIYADLIVFDAISGSIAEKNLMELAEIPGIREKPFLILLDELFPIDVEKINLPHKSVLNRDVPAELVKEEVDKLYRETRKEREKEEAKPEEEEGLIETTHMLSFEETEGEEKEEKEEIKEEVQAPPQAFQPEKEIVQKLSEKLSDEKFVKIVLVEAISETLQGLREEIKAEVREYIKDALESVLREEVEKVLLDIGVVDIIREETRKILEKKISELLE